MHGTRIGVAATALSFALGFAGNAFAAMPPEAPADESVAIAQQQEFNRRIIATLLSEDTPRSLILASMMQPFSDDRADTVALIERARMLAPADAFVQWFAAMREAPAEVSSEAQQAMQRLEPDNGAVWILALQKAQRGDDAAAVTDALARLAAATRDDERLGELTAVWLDFFDRHPELLVAPEDAIRNGYDPSARALVQAISISVAVAIPAYQNLSHACAAGDPAFDARRQADCASTAARMAAQAPTLISRAIGLSILRRLEDARFASAERNWEYLQWQSMRLQEPALADPVQSQQLIRDWRETRSEVGVIERALERAGLPVLPPADWKKPGTRGLAAAAQQPTG